MSKPLCFGFFPSARFSTVARSLGAVLALGLWLASPAAALTVPTDCLADSDGANDLSGAKDVTKFCIDAGDNAPFELNAIINLDITSLNGANTAEVCELFNTDGDAFANLAVCITSAGNPLALQAVRLFTCDNSKADRCGGSTLVAGPYTTECEVTQQDTDPFPGPAPGPGEDYPTDTEILCGIDLDDFGPAGVGALLQDACSYSSPDPNSNSSDCISFALCTVDSDCDDGNVCTIDSCDSTGVCQFTADTGAACDDGQFCNGEEVCTVFGLCGAGSGGPVDCDDGVTCTLDTCDELGDVCQNDPMNSLCNDGEFCTGVETCDPLNDCQVGAPPNCTDGIPCTTDTCDEANDSCDHAPDDGACDNGTFCDGAETCNESLGCQAGTPPTCDDALACTTDSCDVATDACENLTNDAACSDGAFCNGAETCDATLGCLDGTAPDCEDAIACTTDTCDEVADDCAHTADNSVCDDTLYCNGDELCIVGLGCEDGVAPSCGDGVDCTTDSCNETTDACDHATDDASCDNGDYCDGSEVCDATLDCRPGTAPDCSDGVGCTTDDCNESTNSCTHAPSTPTCDDGLYCNGDETCDPVLDCQDGTPPECGDAIACTIDSCNEATDSCNNTPDDSECDDSSFCTGVETCVAGIGCAVGVVPDCDDGVRCTDDSCDAGTDACSNVTNDAVCDDGAYCNGEETCDAVNDCQDGGAPDCTDGVSCTVDSCNEDTDECDNDPFDALCDDGAHCNGDETCDAVNDCQDGTSPDCADGVDCTTDSCNETTDSCDNVPDNAPCSDGDFCTGVEICDPVEDCEPGTDPCPALQCDEQNDMCFGCQSDAECDNGVHCDGVEICTLGVCGAGASPNCDDGVSCTIDSCNEDTDTCDHPTSNAACDDGLHCNGAETCDAVNDCQDGSAPDCNDGVPCSIDTCNEMTDTCDHSADDSACDDGQHCNGAETCDPTDGCNDGAAPNCDDGVACTGDSCNEDTDSCDHAENDAACSDSVFCNGAETCSASTGCEPALPPDCDDGVDCTIDSCYELGGVCMHAPSNAFCDDGAHCNGGETCDATNDCQAGTAPDCGDGVDCTVDACNEQTDACDHPAVDAECDNGDFCDGAETCDPVNDCQDAASPDCDDAVPCTVDMCDEANDECAHTPDDTACSDGVFCNGAETCDEMAGCEAATPLTCDDGIACTNDTCDEAGAACVHQPNDVLCADNEFCNGVEICNPQSGCEAGSAQTCGDGVDCTVDTCDEVNDGCDHTPSNALCNDGLYCNGVETCNAVTDCVSGAPVPCGDQFVCTRDSCNETTDTCMHDFTTCVCGDMEITGNEQCDPSAVAGTYEDCNDNIDDDGDGKVDCRDKDCKPGARPEICDESCSLDQVCERFIRDPARITYDTQHGPDEFYIHGRILMRSDKLRSVVHAFTFELSTPNGPVYRASLDEDDLRGGIAGRRFRFRDSQAPYLGNRSAKGGLERVWVRTRKFEGVRYLVFTVRAYGDFSKANHRLMTTELSIGTEVGFLTAEWTATPRGWLLHQKNFD